jgi:nitroimidazol reductase NimA-like FMN-containing flavoprotein (pyridoxamine 5'-phosphate oxidase superfamily)
MTVEYAPTAATTPTRKRDRMNYDADAVHAILDEVCTGHISFIAHGLPQVLPISYGRSGSRLFVHGSTGSHLALAVRAAGAEGLPVSFAVTHTDRLVFSRSQMNHSADYRSVIAHGRLCRVHGEAAQREGFSAIIDHMVPGRSADCRAPDRKELAMTALFVLELDQVAARARTHGLSEQERDVDLPHWAGVVPLSVRAGTPQSEQAVPDYLARWLADRP